MTKQKQQRKEVEITFHIYSLAGKQKRIGVMNLKEELTSQTISKIMKKIRSKFSLKTYPTLIVSDQKTLHKHREDQTRKVSPFTDRWSPGSTWIEPSMLSSHGKTGYAEARS